MAVTGRTGAGDRVTFWFGCNMLRHAEMIRLSILLLEKVGYDVAAAGGPAYCCGTAHDSQPQAASTMAARTVASFNAAAEKDHRSTVVTWCPSCHMHAHDIMAPGNEVRFDVGHITAILAARIERLAPQFVRPVARRVLLHRHAGFATHVAVNEHVRCILTRIPGLVLTEGPAHPGHMCSALTAVPGALAAAAGETWRAAHAAGADTVSTIFHSCHRELAALDGREGVRVVNWLHLIAETMDLPVADAYREWRTGGTPGESAVTRAGPTYYERLVEPELRKASPLPR